MKIPDPKDRNSKIRKILEQRDKNPQYQDLKNRLSPEETPIKNFFEKKYFMINSSETA